MYTINTCMKIYLIITFVLISGSEQIMPQFPPKEVTTMEICERKKAAAEEYFTYQLENKPVKSIAGFNVQCQEIES